MIGTEEIQARIPHRFPMLLVDEVAAVEPGRHLVARKTVSRAEACQIRPGADPAYPVHLMIESWLQAAALLMLWCEPCPDARLGRVLLAGALDDVTIVGHAGPGDVIEHQVRLVRVVADTAILLGETRIGSRTVLEVGHFVAALRATSDLAPD
jgi:3-hydroxyacyl-[acyl-carrier-protein] dehydratase